MILIMGELKFTDIIDMAVKPDVIKTSREELDAL